VVDKAIEDIQKKKKNRYGRIQKNEGGLIT
jgi:hypothetical protein